MINQKNRKVICLEGIVGAGKTTQIELLYKIFSPDCYLIPELNEISPMKEIRKELKKTGRISNMTEKDVLNLIKAKGRIHQRLLQETNDNIILMDRGIYTGMVFESGPMNMWEIEEISKRFGVIVPDICFILDCSPVKALERVDERRMIVGKYRYRAFHENKDYITKTRNKYFEIAEKRPVILIDSSGNKKEVYKKIIGRLKDVGFL